MRLMQYGYLRDNDIIIDFFLVLELQHMQHGCMR